MGVHRLNDGRWFIQYRIKGTDKKAREYFGRGPLAEASARRRFEQIGVRPYNTDGSPGIGPTFYDVIADYLKDRQRSLAESTWASLLDRVEANYLPALGELPVMRIDEDRIRTYIEQRCAKVKQSTVRRELNDIRAVLNWAVKQKIILYNPMAGATWPRSDDESIRPPSADEIRRLIANAPAHFRRAMVISWYVGLRVGEELFSRRWQDIDWDNQNVYVVSARKKGIDERRVPIVSEFYPRLLQWYIEDQAAIEELAKKQGQDMTPIQVQAAADQLYIIRWRGKRIYKIKTAWRFAKQRAGITRRVRPYDIRHSFVTDLLDGGADAKAVGGMVGHKQVSTTMYVYNHVSGDRQRQIIEKRKSILE